MALDLLQNCVSAQYLENKSTAFDQTLLTIYTDKICVEIVSCHFSHIYTSVKALDNAKKNSVQYL